MEKTLIVKKNDKPVLKFHLKAEHTSQDIQEYFTKKFPNYFVTFFNDNEKIVPYNFKEIESTKIIDNKIVGGVKYF